MPTLHWLTRNDDVRASHRAPYRLLEHVPGLSEGPPESRNMLIQGDNLDALKAVLPFFAGQVRCIYIDPPYNTRSAFEHYDDNLEHTQWLAMMWPRLELLREFLSENGSIWVSIDDTEAHYLKVMMDELFGRRNFVATVAWQRTHTRENRTDFSAVHDYILVFARNRDVWKDSRNMLPPSESQLSRFKNLDGDARGPWASLPAHAKAEKGRRREQFFTVTTPSGRKVDPPPGRCWLYTRPRFEEMIADGRIWFGAGGTNVPRVKKFLSEVQTGLVPSTLWPYREVGSTGQAKNEITTLFVDQTPFSTPKPERLIHRLIQISTDPGDVVVDSFLGSGTTAAVAHKMGRRYIGIEIGPHAVSHCAPRLKKVIEGEQGGISAAVGWKGGGGFGFYRLGPSVFGADGCIRADIPFGLLASHIWFSETGHPWPSPEKAACSPFLGVHEGRAYGLLYNGVLGDRRPSGGNVLTHATLAEIRRQATEFRPGFSGPLTIFGESSRLTANTLLREAVVFRQIPYEVRARA